MCIYTVAYLICVLLDSRWIFQNRFKLFNASLNRGNHKNDENTNDAALIKQYYSILSPDIVEKIYHVYEKDLNLFGYSFNPKTLESGGFEN